MSAFQGVLRMASRVLRSVFHLDPSGARTYVRRKQKIILEQNDVQSHLFDVSPRWMFPDTVGMPQNTFKFGLPRAFQFIN